MRSPLAVLIFLSPDVDVDSFFFSGDQNNLKTFPQNPLGHICCILGRYHILQFWDFFYFVMTDEGLLGKRNQFHLFVIIGLFIAKTSAMFFFLADDIRAGAFQRLSDGCF